MRFERTDSFKADCRAPKSERAGALQRGGAALWRWMRHGRRHQGSPGAWPYSLLVKAIAGARAVFEMTWIFAVPDGRVTWEWCTVEAEGHRHPSVRWRRIGDHASFGDP